MNDPPPSTFLLPPSASTFAPRHDALFALLCAVSAVVVLCVVVAIVRGALRKTPAPDGPMPRRLAVVAALGCALLVGWLFVEGSRLAVDEAVAPAGAMEIRAHVYRWAWEFEYPSGVVHRTLVVPIGRPVRLVLTSDEVAHSLAIPAFRVQQVVPPNAVRTLWFTATARGRWPMFCSVQSGARVWWTEDEARRQLWTGHHALTTSVEVLSAADYAAWVRPQHPRGCYAGETVYRALQCHTCHSIDGSPQVAPTFLGLYGRVETLHDGSRVTVDDAYIRSSIVNPQAHVVRGYHPIMPNYQGVISEWQIDALLIFLRSLATPAATPALDGRAPRPLYVAPQAARGDAGGAH